MPTEMNLPTGFVLPGIRTAESNSNAVNILGYTYSPDLRAEIEQANVHYGLDLKMRYDNNASNLLRRSDQWPFLQNGVPALFFHTGLHPDYHTPNDRPEKINYSNYSIFGSGYRVGTEISHFLLFELFDFEKWVQFGLIIIESWSIPRLD